MNAGQKITGGLKLFRKTGFACTKGSYTANEIAGVVTYTYVTRQLYCHLEHILPTDMLTADPDSTVIKVKSDRIARLCCQVLTNPTSNGTHVLGVTTRPWGADKT